MAIDLCDADSSILGVSPRISFSHDLCHADIAAAAAPEVPRADSLLMESNDFDFCVSRSFEQDSLSSCADELFSNGRILPQDIKKQVLPPKPPVHQNSKKENGSKPEEKLPTSSSTSSSNSNSSSSSASSGSSKSLFWRLTRSSSCGSGYTRSLICNLPLLSRSNSTGSAPNRNPKPSSSQSKNSNSTRSTGANGNTKLSSSTSTGSFFYPYSTSSKKNYGSKNNGIRVNPILNVPPPYISKGTVNLFGFGSLFCQGKEKVKNKKKRSAMAN